MKLTRSSYSLKALLLIIFLGIQHGISNAKAVKKPKHGVNKSGSKKFNAPKGKFCKNHSYCVKYSDLDCASEWVQLNCPRMCRLCEYEGPNLLNLPAVLYYKKGDKKHGIFGKTSDKTKHANKVKKIQRRSEDDGDRRDVVFLSKPYDYAPKPTTPMPTTSYAVFDYKGNYRNWLFLYPDQHPVNLRYVDQGKAKDSNQQTDQQQQSGDVQDASPAGAPVAAGAIAAPTVSPASPAAGQQAAPAFASPATTPGVGRPAMAAAQPWNGAQAAMTNQTQNKTIELINQSVSLASNETQQPGFKPIVPSAQGYDAENSTVPAEGNFTAPNVSESLNETQTFIVSQPNSSKALSQAVLEDHSYSQDTKQESPENELELSQGESLELLPQIQSESQSYSQEKQQSVAFELNSSKSLAQTQYAGASYSQGTHQPEQEFTQNNSGGHSFALKAQEVLEHASKLTPALHEASQILSSKASGVKPYALQTQTQSFSQSPEQLHHDGASLEEPLKTSQPVISPPLSSFHSSQEMAQSEHKLHVDNTDASSKMHGDFSPYGASVYLSGTGNMDLTTTGQVATQDTAANADAPAQTPWTCCRKVPPPKDCKPCPKLPKAPHMPYVFNIYCNDIYKDCAYAYSNCNDTWWEINCPKTCGLCKAKDKVSAPTAKEIMPKEVKDLVNAELESDLVAPVPGEKPLVAKYTLRVKPKLVNGVPQMQEIRIMPPNKSGVSGYVKPLMVLKQNITKPMIENIEIDVPKKGAKFSRKPSVEVIEGDRKETLQVHRGQAVVDDAMQRSNTKSEETQETKPEIEAKEDSAERTQSPANTTTEQTAANYTTTEQTQSSSTTTPYQGSINQTPEAQTQSTPTTATADQNTASYQAYTQPQATSTASATETTALSSTETCTDDNLCATYVESQCSEPWLAANCKSKCKLC